MSSFTNNQVHIPSLPVWEDVVFEKVSRKYANVIVINYLILIVIFCLLAFAAMSVASEDLSSTNSFYAIGGVIVVFSVFCGLHLWSFTKWGYALRDKDMLFRSGVLTRQVEIVPYRHIQHVNVKEGVISRAFGLVSIEVFTAGSGKSVKVLGIPRENSAQIQAFISARIATKQI